MTGFRTRGPAVPPATRPHRQRRAVRVLLWTADGHLLLLQDTDPGLPGTSWWTTPGGGIDEGESALDAALREVHEETGRLFAPDTVGGPVATRRVRHGYSDQITTQEEVFFAIGLPATFEISSAGYTPAEQQSLVGHRWWPVAELASTTAVIWPSAALDLVRLAQHPAAWPVDLGEVEESTVPIG